MAGVSRRQATLTVSDGTLTVRRTSTARTARSSTVGGSTRGPWTKATGSVSGRWCSMWSGCIPMTPGSPSHSIRAGGGANTARQHYPGQTHRPPGRGRAPELGRSAQPSHRSRRRRRSGSHRCSEFPPRGARRRGRLPGGVGQGRRPGGSVCLRNGSRGSRARSRGGGVCIGGRRCRCRVGGDQRPS